MSTAPQPDEPWIEQDIAYFEAHPEAHQYTRDFHEMEWAQIAGPDRPRPPGAHVVVHQIQPGFRARQFHTGSPLGLGDIAENARAAYEARQLLSKVQP